MLDMLPIREPLRKDGALNPSTQASALLRRVVHAAIPALAALLTGCASERAAAPSISESDARALIRQALPGSVSDSNGWVEDIYTGFTTQGLQPTHENICAVVAVIEQESGFHVNPVVPGLPAIAWKEIRTRAEHSGVPWLLVHGALELKSPTGLSYGDRIDRAKTEKDLSDIYEDFIGSVPLGRTLFEDHNPIRTRGPMQVNVAFLKRAEAARNYPYPVKSTMADELFSRRGSVYFGIAHLLGYPAPYPGNLFRFADYNAGQYASRNAAFQSAVSAASGIALTPDGALLPRNGDLGATESAVRVLEARLGIEADSIHSALEEGNSAEFERTSVYKRVFALAEQTQRHPMPRALVPRIKLQSPKLSRTLTTDWYAHRVDGRFQQCLKR
jgi:hypothetical protein